MFDPRLRRTALLASVASTLLATGCSSSKADETPEERASHQPPVTDGWVTLGGDVFSTFNNRTETILTVDNVGKLEVDWIHMTLAAPTGTAAIVDDVAFVTSQGKTYALQLPGGDVIWEGKGSQSSPAYYDGVVYIHTGPGELIAYDAESGEELWLSYPTDHPTAAGYSSPVVSGDLVYIGTSSAEEVRRSGVLSFRGSVVAFDRVTGNFVWRYYTVDEEHTGATVWSSVSVDAALGLVYASTGNNYSGEGTDTSDAVIALDMLSGEVQWINQVQADDVYPQADGVRGPDFDFGANPILFDFEIDGEMRKLLGIGQKSGIFYVMDRTDGENIWQTELSEGIAETGGVLNNGAFDGTNLLVASNRGTSTGAGSVPPRGATSILAALDPATGEIVWERQLGQTVWAPITVANGVGFVSTNLQIEAFDVRDGTKLFAFEAAGSIASGAVVKDGRVYFGAGLTYIDPRLVSASTFYSLKLP